MVAVDFTSKLRNNIKMQLSLRTLVIVLITSLGLFCPNTSRADGGREFLLSCTYGVLAGALVGAASLAVEDNPSDKVHRVARGASLGLYGGIILGLYVVYVVPAQIEANENQELEEQYEEVIEPDDYGSFQQQMRRYEPPKLSIYPVIENNRVTGAALNYSIVRF